MKLLSRAVDSLALWVLLIGGFGMAVATLLGVADVVGTQFLGKPVHGTLEITEMMMVLIVFGGLAYAQIRRSHIRVELLYARSGPRVRAAMDVLADVAALLFYSLLVWQGLGEARYSWQIGEAADGLLRFPLYPARIILCLGTLLLLARLLLDLVTDVGRLISGKDDGTAAPLIPEATVEAALGGKAKT